MPESMPRDPGSSPLAADKAGYGLAFLAAACWALGGLGAKWLFSPLNSATESWPLPPIGVAVDPMVLAAARAIVACVVLWPYMLLRRREDLVGGAASVPFMLALGVVMALMHFTYYKTISLTGVAIAILLEYLAPVVALAFGVVVLRERLTWTLPVGVLLSVTGCGLVAGVARGELAVSWRALIWGLAAAVAFASYSLMGRIAAGRFSAWTLLAWGLGFAALFWLVIGRGGVETLRLLSEPRALAAVLVLSVVSTILPFWAFLAALRHIDATRATVTATVEPAIAGLAAFVLLGEAMRADQLLGAVLVLTAVIVVQRPVRERPPSRLPFGV